MQSFRALASLCFVLACPAVGGATSSVPDFLLAKGVSQSEAVSILETGEKQDICLATENYLVCICSDMAKGDPDVNSRLTRALGLRVRDTMWRHMVFRSGLVPFKHKEVFYRGFAKGSYGSKYLPSGLETASSHAGVYVYCAAAVPRKKALDEFEAQVQASGREDYCKALVDCAADFEKSGKFADAIELLDDPLSLQKDSVQGQILFASCLAKTDQADRALKYARSALAAFRDRLSSDECEMLGETFLILEQKDEATECFILASERFQG